MAARRGLLVVGVGLFGLVGFLLASGYLIDRGQPVWLAATLGALTFPVLPVAWHVIGERHRKKQIAAAKTPPKTTLAPSDRYILRAIAVTLVVLGPMFAVGGFGVVRAAWEQKLWWLPGGGIDSGPGGDASKHPLVAHVPSDAEAVLLVRDKILDNDVQLYAYGSTQLLAIVAAELSDKQAARKIKEVNGNRKVPFAPGLKADPVERLVGPTGLFIAASEGWRSKVTAPGSGPSEAIRRELDRAPSNASVVVAFVPTKPIAEVPIESLAAWAVIDKPAEETTLFGSNTRIVIHARAETTSVDVAEDLLTKMRARSKRDDVPAKCRDDVDAIANGVTLERSGRVIVLHLELHAATLVAAITCALNGD